MKLQDVLARKRSRILAKWLNWILGRYPAESARFLKREKDQFANPVGHTISRGIEVIYDQLVRETDPEEVSSSLDSIIRIKAVQDSTPSEAIAFIFQLKRILREELRAEIGESLVSPEELLDVELRIDSLALRAFDAFVKCREKIYELRADQVRNRTFRLLKRANLITEIPDEEPDLRDENEKRGNGK